MNLTDRLLEHVKKYTPRYGTTEVNTPWRSILTFPVHTTKTRASSMRTRIERIVKEIEPTAVVTLRLIGNPPKTRSSLTTWKFIISVEHDAKKEEDDVCLL